MVLVHSAVGHLEWVPLDRDRLRMGSPGMDAHLVLASPAYVDPTWHRLYVQHKHPHFYLIFQQMKHLFK